MVNWSLGKVSLKRAFKSEFICSLLSQKILTDLKSNFTKFKFSTIFLSREWQLRFPIRKTFPFEILPELPITNSTSISYSYIYFSISALQQSCCQDKVKGQKLYISCFLSKCKPAFQTLIFCHNIDKKVTLK